MASPNDYRKPRNKELLDLVWNLPHPLRVKDGDGRILWQNRSAETLEDDASWSTHSVRWQNLKAVLELTSQGQALPSMAKFKELEAEVSRLKKQQRQTARKKRKAEDSARREEKSALEVAKKERKLRQQIEKLERENSLLSNRVEQLEEDRDEARQSLAALEVSTTQVADTPASEDVVADLESLKVELDRAREEAALRLQDVERHRAENARQAEALLNALEQVEILEGALSNAEPAALSLASDPSLDQRLAALEEDKKTLEAWIEELEQREAGSQKANRELQRDLERLQRKLDERQALAEDTAVLASLESQLAEKVAEFDALEAALEREQASFLEEKQELQGRLAAQEEDLERLKASIKKAAAPKDDSELREELADMKADLQLAERREKRLAEKLRTLEELRAEHSEVLNLLKDDLRESRERERELKETLKLYSDFRKEMDSTRAESKSLKSQLLVLRETEARLERELAQARSQPSLPAQIDPSAETISMSKTVKNQIDFLKQRLSGTEKKLDETKALLEQERTQSKSSKEAEKLAYQDPLTGLPNRNMVERYLVYAHQQARASGRALGLFLIDLDGFRLLNETYGRAWGDTLLKAVGARLNGMRGASHLVARSSQDQFILLAADIDSSASTAFVRDASKSLLEALAYPFEIEDEEVKLTGTIGVSLGPLQGESSVGLFDFAGEALERAKRQGPANFVIYDEGVRVAKQREALYSSQMIHAVEKNEFKAVFQPVFNLVKGIVLGLELLLRWEHRDQRELKPADFLEAAINSGIIFDITEKIWPKAFREFAKWRKMRPGLTLSINLSDRELLNPSVLKRAIDLARENQVDPKSIIFEVRDQSRLRRFPTWWKVLQDYSTAGFGLCLDDFASDASLFGTLAFSGFTQAKMNVQDQSSLKLITAPQASKGVLYGVKRLQTKFDNKALARAGFHLAQGYAVSPPLDYVAVDSVLS